MIKNLAETDAVYTTGQVARLCRVSARTACSWVDSGRLSGYRIPGSLDRRIPKSALLSFLKTNEMPIPFELTNVPQSTQVSYGARQAAKLLDAGWTVRYIEATDEILWRSPDSMSNDQFRSKSLDEPPKSVVYLAQFHGVLPK